MVDEPISKDESRLDPRCERIWKRDRSIMEQIACGVSRQKIMDDYQISERQFDGIIKEINAETEHWLHELTHTYFQEFVRINNQEILRRIKQLEEIADATDDPYVGFSMNERIIKCRIAYAEEISEGPILVRLHDISKTMDEDED